MEGKRPSRRSSSWDAEKDTDALFCNHTVDEIRQIAQRTRLDIERKKEDLRQMVGERYRDLIDAADSIVDMKTYSGHVHHSISSLTQLCQRLQQTHLVKGAGGVRALPTQSENHFLAAQMKILTDTPEQIWVCLEEQGYLKATRRYLLAGHVYQLLLASQGRPNPALQRLWNSVTCFKETILECCRRHLQSNDVSQEAMVESLSAIVLLEGCSLRQVFAQFLVARKAAIQDVLRPHTHGHCSVKSQVCQVVGVIRSSLFHVSAIFCQSGGKQVPSLLLRMLNEFTAATKKADPIIPDELGGRVPTSIADFSPSLRTSTSEVPLGDIHSSCEEWIATCAQDVEQGIELLFQHVTTVKALASIREAIHELLSQPTDPEGDESAREWFTISSRVLGRDLSLWDSFLRPLLFNRAKAILDSLFVAAETHGTSTLDQLLQGMGSNPSLYAPDRHISSYLWQEDSGGRAKGGINTLHLKAKAYTPSVYSFCQSFGEKLGQIMEDSAHYLGGKPSQAAIFPFHLHGDSGAMQDYLQLSTSQCIARFLSGVDSRVTELGREMAATHQQPVDSTAIVDRLLMVGRVCQSLTDCCPNLSQLSQGRHDTSVHSTHRTPTRSQRLLSQSRRKEAEAEKNATDEMLQKRAAAIYRLWADWCAGQFRNQLQEQLSAEMELNSLSSTLAWQEITISEESESGTKVSSVIRVPEQTSVYVVSLLFALCQEINRIGGHAIDRSLLVYLSGCVMEGIVGTYETILRETTTPMPQSCAVQLLFNIRFLSSVLAVPSEAEEEVAVRVKDIGDRLQTFIDPFDLDVFMPHILSNLEKQLQRSTVLLGVLHALRGPAGVKAIHKSTTGTTQEKHIVIPLTQTVPRFPSLPISAPQQFPVPKTMQVSSAEQPASPLFLRTLSFFHHL